MNRKRVKKAAVACLLGMTAALGLCACQGASQDTAAQTDENTETAAQEEKEMADLDFTVSYDGIATAKLKAGVSVHDPSIIKADGKYYIFGSHMSTAVSDDLQHWTAIGSLQVRR